MSARESAQGLPVVICPGCGKAMLPKGKERVTEVLIDVTYVCESCGTETKRTIKEDQK